MTSDLLRRLVKTRLGPLLDARVHLRDVSLDRGARELCLRGSWSGEGPRELRGRASLPPGHPDERALLLALAQALAVLAGASGLGLTVLGGVRRREPQVGPHPSRRDW